MTKEFLMLLLPISIILASCTKVEGEPSMDGGDYMSGGSADGGNSQAGVVTAGEWNDLRNWDFWSELMLNGQDQVNEPYARFNEQWNFYTQHRVAVRVTDAGGSAIAGARVDLLWNGEREWSAITNNSGECNLWYGLYDNQVVRADSAYQLKIDDATFPAISTDWTDSTVHWNTCVSTPIHKTGTDIAFIVDATGSMGDEIRFLKDDLSDIIQKINIQGDLRTAALFYRDEQDEYITKHNDFQNDHAQTQAFIAQQQAGGGGDYPEAVHTALEKGLQELNWNENARVKIAFLMLDAPAHDRKDVKKSLQKSIQQYAAQGIRLIPIAASGADKSTEFMLRYFAIATDGTYVFLTNDSGVGNEHIEATVGEYEVERLNDLLVRLINEFTE